jgi:hypothetical protein
VHWRGLDCREDRGRDRERNDDGRQRDETYPPAVTHESSILRLVVRHAEG